MSPANPTPEPTTGMVLKRRALKLGLLASLFALVGRATARAQDALTIEPDGATIYAKYINFRQRMGALLTLWDPGYELGIQPATIYARSGKNFAWYKGGEYVEKELDAGKDGVTMMSLSDGTLTVSDKFVGKGDAAVEKGLTVGGAFVDKGDATLGKSLTVAGGVATQKTAGANTLDVQKAERTIYDAPKANPPWKGEHPTGLALYVTATSGEADKLVEFRHSNGTQGIGFGYNTIYATGPYPDQPLRLKAFGNGRVEVVHPGQKTVVAAGGVEALRMLRGVVRSDGTVSAGAGFKSQRKDQGLYDITFDTPFSSLPGASVTEIFKDGGGDPLGGPPGNPGSTLDNAVIVYLGKNMMRVATGQNNGDRRDRYFSFVVMGPP